MLVSNSEALARLSSPLNLINRMKAVTDKKASLDIFSSPKDKIINGTALSLFDKPKPSTPSDESPSIDNLIENAESKIKLAAAHDNAITLLDNAVSMLSTKLDDIKPERLPAVITAASKMVNDIRRERNEANKNTSNRAVHLHFYTPVQKQESDYNIIEVG